jgi:hypothetical protein
MFESPTCKTRYEMGLGASHWGWLPGLLESKLPLYGILLRASEVNALFIGF